MPWQLGGSAAACCHGCAGRPREVPERAQALPCQCLKSQPQLVIVVCGCRAGQSCTASRRGCCTAQPDAGGGRCSRTLRHAHPHALQRCRFLHGSEHAWV